MGCSGTMARASENFLLISVAPAVRVLENEVPRVAGQHYSYIVKQLVAFKNRKRTNDAGTMTAVRMNCLC